MFDQLLNEIFVWRARAYRAEAERDEANLRAAREKRRADEAEIAHTDLLNACLAAEPEIPACEADAYVDPETCMENDIEKQSIAA